MKKLILTFGLLLVFMGSINAQSQKIRLSFVAEPQLSWLKPDIEGVESRSNKAGYNFGVVMDRFFSSNYAFSTGLTINTTGGKLKYSQVNDTIEVNPVGDKDYNLRYLEIPVGLKLLSNEFRRSRFYARFGLTSQINIEARDAEGTNISDEVRLFDMAYHLGGGLEYSIGGPNALMFGVVFHNGFIDVTDEPDFDDKTVLNRLDFEIGFVF